MRNVRPDRTIIKQFATEVVLSTNCHLLASSIVLLSVFIHQLFIAFLFFFIDFYCFISSLHSSIGVRKEWSVTVTVNRSKRHKRWKQVFGSQNMREVKTRRAFIWTSQNTRVKTVTNFCWHVKTHKKSFYLDESKHRGLENKNSFNLDKSKQIDRYWMLYVQSTWRVLSGRNKMCSSHQ